MKEHESIDEMFIRFSTILNKLNALGEKHTTHKRIKKSYWLLKVTTIKKPRT